MRTIDVVSVGSGAFEGQVGRGRAAGDLEGVAGTLAALLDEGLSFSC